MCPAVGSVLFQLDAGVRERRQGPLSEALSKCCECGPTAQVEPFQTADRSFWSEEEAPTEYVVLKDYASFHFYIQSL